MKARPGWFRRRIGPRRLPLRDPRHVCMYGKKINTSTVRTGRKLGLKEEQKTLEPINNRSPMS